MGSGYIVGCKKCNKDYQLFLGIGMGYHFEYEEVMNQIKSGIFGKRMQEIVNDDEFVAVDAEDKLYVCDKCGDWGVDKSLDLYKPKSRAAVIQNEIDEWSWRDDFLKTISYDEEKNELRTIDGKIVPLSKVLSRVSFCGGNKENYTRVLEVRHICSRCGEVMREVEEDENVELKCPDCGEVMQKNGWVNWD